MGLADDSGPMKIIWSYAKYAKKKEFAKKVNENKLLVSGIRTALAIKMKDHVALKFFLHGDQNGQNPLVLAIKPAAKVTKDLEKWYGLWIHFIKHYVDPNLQKPMERCHVH